MALKILGEKRRCIITMIMLAQLAFCIRIAMDVLLYRVGVEMDDLTEV